MRSSKNNEFKLCTGCKKEFPNNTDYFFHAKQKNKDGTYRHSLRGKCKPCYIGPLKEKIVRTHKTCTNCHIEFPNTTEYYRYMRDIKGCKYLRAWCKKCEIIRGSEYSLIRDHKTRAKELELTVEEYSKNSRLYMGWAAYKSKFPDSTYDEYIKHKTSSRERHDAVRKINRDTLSEIYVKQMLVKRTNISISEIEMYPELIELKHKQLNLYRQLKQNAE